MIVSMTGFGDASTEHHGAHYLVEIRSLNNRYFKPVIKLPDNVAGLEPELESMLREQLGRGTITYILKMRLDSAEAAYPINVAALQSYLHQLRQVDGLGDIARVDLAQMLLLPGVTQEPGGTDSEIERHGDVIRNLSAKAIAKLQTMRQREGKSLLTELLKHIGSIRTDLEVIRERAPFVIDEYHKRLTQRVNQLLQKAELQVGQPDLLREIAVFAERADIAEELQRLSTHLDAFEQSCREGSHAGRKLDFITQEMLREANTIASKANDASIARRIVDIKGAIDRLKEQVQNVE